LDEELISQSLTTKGGLVVYTGMNSNGEFFIGKRRFNATTGESVALNATDTVTATATATVGTADDLTVNNNFYSKGNTEVVDIAFKGNRGGNIGQTIYVGIQNGTTCPTSANDNILFRTSVDRGGYIGWVKTNEANSGVRWKRWGKISHECNSDHYVFDKIGVGVTYARDGWALDVVGLTTISGNTTIVGATNIIGVSTFTGNTTIVGFLSVTQDITAYYTSDQRLKNNITPIPNALDKVLSISGNTFDWNEKSGKEGKEAGVIAQEIFEVLPEVVTTRDNGYLAVDYQKLVPLLIEAIKELKVEIDSLKGGK